MESGAETNQRVCTPRTSGAVASSGGWVRASGLRAFNATLLPPELHRIRSETPAGVEPASDGLQPSAWPPGPGVTFAKPQAAGSRKRPVPQPGVEPGLPPSQGGVISVSPPGHRECPAGVEPAWQVWKTRASPLGHGHVRRKERELNPQGNKASPRFERGAVANLLVLPKSSVRTVGFEPTISGSRSRRIRPGSPTS